MLLLGGRGNGSCGGGCRSGGGEGVGKGREWGMRLLQLQLVLFWCGRECGVGGGFGTVAIHLLWQ